MGLSEGLNPSLTLLPLDTSFTEDGKRIKFNNGEKVPYKPLVRTQALTTPLLTNYLNHNQPHSPIHISRGLSLYRAQS